MSVLSAQSIRRNAIITPFNERTVHVPTGMSWGLSSCGYDVRLKQDLVFRWGWRFQLASTIEHFNMPTGVCARVHDKSTMARRGFAVQNTFIEPGWRGFLTLEITYHGLRPVARLAAGQPIAQIIFEWLDVPTDQPYSGKYQDQADRPVPAMMERA